jgi:hypothetical protein
MPRPISKADRTAAEGFIRQSLTAKLIELNESEYMGNMRKEAKEEVDKAIEYSKTLKKAKLLKTRMDKLAVERDELLGKLDELLGKSSKSGWRWERAGAFEEAVEAQLVADLRDSELGEDILYVKNRLSSLSKTVFLATTHEDLADLVREMS